MAKNRSEGHFRLSSLFSYNAPVVLTFSVISLVVLLLNERLPVDLNRMLFSVYRTSFRDPLMYVRVFTHVLGHADMAHFSQNICLLLVIGPIVEEKYGSRNLLLAMVITAFVTGVLHMVLFPGTVLLGASGIVFMAILMASITNFRDRKIPLTLILVAAIYIGQEIFSGVTAHDNISQFGHIVGGVMGIIFGLTFTKNRS